MKNDLIILKEIKFLSRKEFLILIPLLVKNVQYVIY